MSKPRQFDAGDDPYDTSAPLEPACVEPIGSWKYRRRMMFGVVLFCMGVVVYVLHANLTSPVAETCVTMSFTAIISTVGSYCFSASWDDANARKATR